MTRARRLFLRTWTAPLLLSALPVLAQGPAASTPTRATTTVQVGPVAVQVPANGFYARYQSNTPLSVVQQTLPNIDLSWFKTLPKTEVDVGFKTHSPNFYYDNGRVTAVYTADLSRLKALMPASVMQVVQPVQIWPGRGLVAVTAYTYRECDNDAYNEIAVSIVTNAPGTGQWGPFTLLSQMRAQSLWGHVLKLPVNTELARARGVVGYNLPKWLTGIDLKENDQAMTFTVQDAGTGQTDLVIKARKLSDVSAEPEVVRTSFTNVNTQGQLTTGYALARQLRHASSRDADDLQLTLSGNGPLSSLLRSLQLGRMLKYEYVPSFQGALYTPERLNLPVASR
jgi:hypothetical protein